MICYKIRSKKNNTEDKTHIPQYKFSIFLRTLYLYEAVACSENSLIIAEDIPASAKLIIPNNKV
jgi:hypothetical protein